MVPIGGGDMNKAEYELNQRKLREEYLSSLMSEEALLRAKLADVIALRAEFQDEVSVAPTGLSEPEVRTVSPGPVATSGITIRHNKRADRAIFPYHFSKEGYEPTSLDVGLSGCEPQIQDSVAVRGKKKGSTWHHYTIKKLPISQEEFEITGDARSYTLHTAQQSDGAYDTCLVPIDKLKFDTVTRIWTYDTPRVSRDAPLYTYPPNAFRVTRAILDQMRASGTSVTATDIAQVYLRVGAKVDNVASAAKRMCQHLLKSGYFYEHASGIYGLTKEGRNPTRGAAPGRTKKAKIQ